LDLFVTVDFNLYYLERLQIKKVTKVDSIFSGRDKYQEVYMNPALSGS